MEVYAGMGERREIVLPDSTHVWLNAGTKLIYPKQFNRSMRQVYLSGEMFADVRRDEDRPFIVSADRLEVKVLGTQFNLKSYQEDAKSEVSLVRGKVSVGIKASKMNGKLTLAPGDILRFNKTNNHIDFLNFDPDSYANWIDNNNFFFVVYDKGLMNGFFVFLFCMYDKYTDTGTAGTRLQYERQVVSELRKRGIFCFWCQRSSSWSRNTAHFEDLF